MPEHQQIQQSKKTNTIFQKQATPVIQAPLSNPYSIIQRAKINPKSLTHADVMQLQRTIGNQAVGRLLSGIGSTSTAQQATVQRQEIPEEKGEETCPSCMQRQENPEEKEPLQGKFEDKPEIVCPSCFAAPIVQKQESEEKEKLLQGKMIGTIQRQEIPKEEPLQTKRENNTGMPDNLKAGVENLSGIDMSDVKVHYNSSKPADVGALAYTQGTNIHVAPGQEKHLPHEAWHVVQQKQGRVQPTMLLNGVVINDNTGLEQEADLIGKAVKSHNLDLDHQLDNKAYIKASIKRNCIQRKIIFDDQGLKQLFDPEENNNIKSPTYIDYFYELDSNNKELHFCIDTNANAEALYRIGQGIAQIALKAMPDSISSRLISTLTHEFQHALDSFKKTFSKENDDTKKKVKMELMAFASEAASIYEMLKNKEYINNNQDLLLSDFNNAKLSKNSYIVERIVAYYKTYGEKYLESDEVLNLLNKDDKEGGFKNTLEEAKGLFTTRVNLFDLNPRKLINVIENPQSRYLPAPLEFAPSDVSDLQLPLSTEGESDIRGDSLADTLLGRDHGDPTEIDVPISVEVVSSTSRGWGGECSWNNERRDHSTDASIGLKTTKTTGGVTLAPTTLGTTTPTHKTKLISAEKSGGVLKVKLDHTLNIDVSKPSKTPIDVGTAAGPKGVKKDNWKDIVKDLTPNDMGKSPRLKYWSSQLVDEHEQHHVEDCEAATARGITKAVNKITTKKITKTQYSKRDPKTLASGFEKAAFKIIHNEDWKDYNGVDFPYSREHDQRQGEIRTYQKGKKDYEALVSRVASTAATAGWDESMQKQPRSTITEKKNRTFLRE